MKDLCVLKIYVAFCLRKIYWMMNGLVGSEKNVDEGCIFHLGCSVRDKLKRIMSKAAKRSYLSACKPTSSSLGYTGNI